MEEKIYKRDIFDEIIKYLDTKNIIVLQGARQVGKTYILYYLKNYLNKLNQPTFFFDLEDSRFVEILNQGVDSLLEFLKAEGFSLKSRLYVFIDEIQYLANPSSFLKLVADHHHFLQLIVSGSSSFELKSKFSDSLVGRTVNFEIFNLSFKEFLRFKEIKINFSQKITPFHLNRLKELYRDYLLYSGYPKVVLEPYLERKEKYLQQIIDTYIRKDIRDLANIKEIKKFNDLLKVLAQQSGQLVNIAELSRVCSLSKQTIENYLFILENTYVVKLIPPFSTSPRIEVVKTPKIFFYDTGLLQMLRYQALTKSTLGNIFETSIFGELVKKYGRESIYYWRNKNQKEIDFVLRLSERILPIEVKMNFASFNRKTISAFCQRYNLKDFKVIGLEGTRFQDYQFYPWEI